jgi:ADP-ribose pyrophosphatase YjhB (NUDIX family)
VFDDATLRRGARLFSVAAEQAIMNALLPKFCSQCGGSLEDRFIELEQRQRRACIHCNFIEYRNPQVLVSTIVMAGDQVLLCRRAHAPAAGRWGLPGGFMESGETLEEAAARETGEETGVQLNPFDLRLYAVATLPEISEVYVGFVAEIADGTPLICGAECSEVRLFSEASAPWGEFAYADVAVYLRGYFAERRADMEKIHVGSLAAQNVVSKSYRITAAELGVRPRAALMDVSAP